jgi:hypothetical protein
MLAAYADGANAAVDARQRSPRHSSSQEGTAKPADEELPSAAKTAPLAWKWVAALCPTCHRESTLGRTARLSTRAFSVI